jgi:hypothetical protein
MSEAYSRLVQLGIFSDLVPDIEDAIWSIYRTLSDIGLAHCTLRHFTPRTMLGIWRRSLGNVIIDNVLFKVGVLVVE